MRDRGVFIIEDATVPVFADPPDGEDGERGEMPTKIRSRALDCRRETFHELFILARKGSCGVAPRQHLMPSLARKGTSEDVLHRFWFFVAKRVVVVVGQTVSG